MSNLIRPNAVGVKVQMMDGPNAHPASLTLQQPGGISLLLVGGVSKRVAIAAQLMAGGSMLSPREALALADELLALDAQQNRDTNGAQPATGN